MPSRYSPAMDPYIERTGIWGDFHGSLITEIKRQLNRRLPRNYIAISEERLRLGSPEDVDPDYDGNGPVRRPQPDVVISGKGVVVGQAQATSLAAVVEPSCVAHPEATDAVEFKDHYVEVIRLPEREVITTIEVLSPANKRGDMRRDYHEKRDRTRRSGSHLVEIDLLLAGRRLDPETGMPRPGTGYCAVLSRRESYPVLLVYAWPAGDPLPAVPIPLRAPDDDVLIDLGPAVDDVFDDGRYDELLRYDADARPAS